MGRQVGLTTPKYQCHVHTKHLQLGGNSAGNARNT